jgi:hypothetical protein
MVSIILTVPHSVCVDNNNHTCDYSAESFADILKEKLIENKFDTKIIKSEQNRLVLDDNRFQNKYKNIKKDSLLWKTLRNTIKTNKNTIIFDIHSYPDHTENFGNNDIVILDNTPYQTITTELMFYLSDNGITISIYSASTGHNSILDVFTLHPLYIPVILLEINEKLNKDELNKVAKLIINFIEKKNNKTMIGKNYPEIKYHYLRMKSLLKSLF